LAPHTEVWRNKIFCRGEILIKGFRNIAAEIGIKCISGFKNKMNWEKTGLYMIKKKKNKQTKR
jgi:hypothetical protein